MTTTQNDCLGIRVLICDLSAGDTTPFGAIKVGKGEGAKPNSKFETYFDFQEKISSLSDPRSSHRYLAIRRGVHEKELQWSIFSSQVESNWDSLFLPLFEAAAVTVPESPGAQVLKSAAHLALHAVVLPAIESEAHKSIRKVADEMAIQVFVENLRTILLSRWDGLRFSFRDKA
jgi:uncharacterized protein